MAKDFALLAEAYKSIYEAGEVTGVVAAPGTASAGVPTNAVAAPATAQPTTPPIVIQASDSTKLIKNINDIYAKTRENADILSRNKMPNAKEQFNSQKTYFGQIIASIVSATADNKNPSVLKGLTGGLDKDLLSYVQPQQASTATTTPIKAVAKQ